MIDLIDYALRSDCRWAMCRGPLAPIRHQQTCTRCACINRALRMGIIRVVDKQYINKRGFLVAQGVLEIVEAA